MKDAGFSAVQSRGANLNLSDLDAAGCGFDELKPMYPFKELAQTRQQT